MNSKWLCFPWRSPNLDFSFVLLLSFEVSGIWKPYFHYGTGFLMSWPHVSGHFGASNHTIRWDHDQVAVNHAWELAMWRAAKQQKESEATLCHLYIHLPKSPAPLSVLSCKLHNKSLHNQGLLPACPRAEMPNRTLTEGQFVRSGLLSVWKRALCESGWAFCKRVLWLQQVTCPLCKIQRVVTIYLCNREERASLKDQLSYL